MFDRTADITFPKQDGDALESVTGGLARNAITISGGQRRSDPADQPGADFWIANSPDFLPQRQRQVLEIVAAYSLAGLGEAVGVRRAATGLRDRHPFHEARSHQPVEPLADRRGCYPEPGREVAYLERMLQPQQFDDG